jgi:RNA-directed DNA polymerase
MTMASVRHQMPASISDETLTPRHEPEGAGRDLLTQALAREYMQSAWKRVKANKGAAGVDGRDIAQTGQHLKHAWPTIRQQLMEGTYRPTPVRRVGIPKPDGSERELGIPTVTDRLIQQALLQVLQPLIVPTFSEHSHGFRPATVRVTPCSQHSNTCWTVTASWSTSICRVL